MKSNASLMISIWLLWMPLVFVCFSQQSKEQAPVLLLPKPLHVEGRVVDPDGKAVNNVIFLYTNRSGIVESDSNGKFQFDSSAPSFVAEKIGFESTLVRNGGSVHIRVVLRKLPPGTSFPVCSETDFAKRARGWRGVLQIPKEGIKKSYRERLNTDYWSRSVRIKSDSTTVFAYQGRGPLWGGEMPDEETIWGAARYRGKSYDFDGWSIADAKVWLQNGSCSRIIGTFRESVFYEKVACGLVKPLDDLLDKVCIDHNVFQRLVSP